MDFHFEQLTVWQEAMRLVESVYRLTRLFPEEEKFGLTSQLRRAAVSISANIAEGKGRFYKKEFLQFLYTARGSLYETITLIRTSAHLSYLQPKDQDVLLGHCQRIASQLSGLINSLK